MAFDLSTVTTVGSTMLAKATVGNKLIIDGCGISDEVYTLEQAQALQLFSGTMESNRADIVGFTTNHVVFRASFPANDTYGGTRHSLILFGHMQNDETIRKNAIAVCSDTDGFVLPKTTDVVNHFECLFTVQYALDPNVITVQTSALETSKAEFDAFKADVVTREGEQDINGDKTFNGKVTINSNIEFTESSRFSGSFINGETAIDGDGVKGNLVTCNFLSVTTGIFGNGVIYTTGAITAGGDMSCLNLTATNNVNCKHLIASYDIDSPKVTGHQVFATSNVVTPGIISETGTLTLAGYDVADKVVVEGVFEAKSNRVNEKVTIERGNITAYGKVTASEVSSPKLTGVIPAPKYTDGSQTLEVPVGAMVCMILDTTEIINSGSTITVNTNSVRPARFQIEDRGQNVAYNLGVTVDSSLYITAGTYVVIIGSVPTLTLQKCAVLAMRIE